jgi:hypothetical protein
LPSLKVFKLQKATFEKQCQAFSKMRSVR